ncbi:MAG: SDR family oxidoreductase [Deltaproteobacteria bacterium]|nr:SDR family oxidoreductase [Deltaproteobacteria bacterium]
MATSQATSSPAPIALITGGSRGIGRATALLLASRGSDVIVTYRTAAAEARDLVAQLEGTGRRAAALALDVAASSTFPAFVEQVRATLRGWGRDRVTALVNNAGSGAHAPFAETTEAQFQAMFDVHLKGPYFLTQALLPLLADGARIVNVSTGLSRYTYPGQSAYGIMKGGVDVMTRFLARELGPRHIAVNAIALGGIATDFGGGVMRDPGLQRAVAEQTALGRIGVAEDAAGAIAMLIAPESGWVTGQRIEVTGGYML